MSTIIDLGEKTEMTVASASTAALNGENSGTDLAGVVDLVVARLCPGMSRSDALRTLATATGGNGNGANPIAETAGSMLADADRAEMVNRFSGIILMLEHGLPASANARLTPYQASMLGQAAELCLTITDPYWECIALSLRTECLLLLSLAEANEQTAAALRGDATQAASISLETYPVPGESHPVLEDRQAYNQDVIAGRTPPVTTTLFLHKLHEELMPRTGTLAEMAHNCKEPLLIPA